jgi:hypothetical protein
MKKRIQITVQPVDNGYMINGNYSDEKGQNQKTVNLIAADADEVNICVTKIIASAFASATTFSAATPTVNA